MTTTVRRVGVSVVPSSSATRIVLEIVVPQSAPASQRPARRRSLVAAVLATALLLAACGADDGAAPGEDPTASPDASDSTNLNVAIASFDIAVGEDQRLLAGLLSDQRDLLAHGEVTFQLGFLGDEPGGETELTQEVTASFLGIPGGEPEGDHPTPRFLEGPGNGVYTARVDLDQPGNWGLRVVAELEDGRVLEGQAVFPVLEEPLVPAVGDPAPRTENPTIADAEAGRVEPAAIDSRAGGTDGTIPDPQLHDAVIADLLAAGEPFVVAITTPVYCVSRFCGPLTNVLADMALDHEDELTFVHLEVWEDHGEAAVNPAAAEWILPAEGADGREPWVFVVDGDGIITARWDNVLDLEEFEAALDAL